MQTNVGLTGRQLVTGVRRLTLQYLLRNTCERLQQGLMSTAKVSGLMVLDKVTRSTTITNVKTMT